MRAARSPPRSSTRPRRMWRPPKEGARLRLRRRAPEPTRCGRTGYFYLPTVLDQCHRGMRVVREETFGPMVTVETFPPRTRP